MSRVACLPGLSSSWPAPHLGGRALPGSQEAVSPCSPQPAGVIVLPRSPSLGVVSGFSEGLLGVGVGTGSPECLTLDLTVAGHRAHSALYTCTCPRMRRCLISVDTGVINMTFPLSDQPVLGEWFIFVEMQGHVYNKSFEVQKYGKLESLGS